MTTLLEQAFRAAAKLPESEQDVLAARLLAELQEEDDFDRRIAATAHQLASLAEEARTEHHAGLTQALDAKRP